MSDIKNLEPKLLWKYFHEITQIPRPSKKEQKMTEFMKKFGLDNGLETIVDKTGNVIISVITSYSIHYTKLYEEGSLITRGPSDMPSL